MRTAARARVRAVQQNERILQLQESSRGHLRVFFHFVTLHVAFVLFFQLLALGQAILYVVFLVEVQLALTTFLQAVPHA
jgi:hypothetical protein